MKLPTIHMNGSPRQMLLDEAETAYASMHDAIDAVRAMTVNGRDFYPQGPNAAQEAMREHERLIRQLCEARAEIEQYIEGLLL